MKIKWFLATAPTNLKNVDDRRLCQTETLHLKKGLRLNSRTKGVKDMLGRDVIFPTSEKWRVMGILKLRSSSTSELQYELYRIAGDCYRDKGKTSEGGAVGAGGALSEEEMW